MNDRIEKIVKVGPGNSAVGYIDSKRKRLPCKIYIYSLSSASVTLLVNFNKPATAMDRVMVTTQRHMNITSIYESSIYAQDSIRFRVESDSPMEIAIKAEFEPPAPGSTVWFIRRLQANTGLQRVSSEGRIRVR